MRIKKCFSFLFVLFLFCLLSTEKGFAIVERMNLKQLIDKSNRIIVGMVTDIKSQWENEDGKRLIFTYVTIKIDTYVKGLGSEIVTIKVPGGKVGDLTQWVSDTPHFDLGEKVLLFLRDEYFLVVGGNQGKFSIQDNTILGLNITVYEFINQIGTTLVESSAELLVRRESQKLSTFPVPTHEGNIFLDLFNKQENEYTVYNTRDKFFQDVSADSWTTIMTEDFEEAFPSGLWRVSGDPTWGADDYQPHTGLASAWCASGGSSPLDPAENNYANNMNAWMIYGPFDLSDASDAELLFY